MRISQRWVAKGKSDITAESAFPRGTESHQLHNMERYTETTALRTTLRKDKDDKQREERA